MEVKEVKTEPEVMNMRSKKPEYEQWIDYEDVCVVLCIICASMITHLLYSNKFIILFDEKLRDALVIVICIAFITLVLVAITRAMVSVKLKKKSPRC